MHVFRAISGSGRAIYAGAVRHLCRRPQVVAPIPDEVPLADPTLALDLSREALAVQLQSVDAIDAKVGTFFAAGSAILALVVAVVAIRPGFYHHGGAAILVMTGLCYAGLAVVCGWAVWPRDWDWGPELADVWADAAVPRPFVQMQAKAAWRYRDDVDANRDRLAWKATLLQAAFVLMALETAAFAVGVGLAIS